MEPVTVLPAFAGLLPDSNQQMADTRHESAGLRSCVYMAA